MARPLDSRVLVALALICACSRSSAPPSEDAAAPSGSAVASARDRELALELRELWFGSGEHDASARLVGMLVNTGSVRLRSPIAEVKLVTADGGEVGSGSCMVPDVDPGESVACEALVPTKGKWSSWKVELAPLRAAASRRAELHATDVQLSAREGSGGFVVSGKNSNRGSTRARRISPRIALHGAEGALVGAGDAAGDVVTDTLAPSMSTRFAVEIARVAAPPSSASVFVAGDDSSLKEGAEPRIVAQGLRSARPAPKPRRPTRRACAGGTGRASSCEIGPRRTGCRH